jgi:hypothetical protein
MIKSMHAHSVGKSLWVKLQDIFSTHKDQPQISEIKLLPKTSMKRKAKLEILTNEWMISSTTRRFSGKVMDLLLWHVGQIKHTNHTIQYNTIQYNTIQYNALNTIQYNTIQYNTIQYNTIQYNANYTPLELQKSMANKKWAHNTSQNDKNIWSIQSNSGTAPPLPPYRFTPPPLLQ